MFDHPSILQRPRLSVILYGRSGLLKVRKNVLSSCFGVLLKASWSVWVAALIRKGQTTDTVFPPRGWGGGGTGMCGFRKISEPVDVPDTEQRCLEAT